MSKPRLFVTSRHGGRVDRSVRQNALDHFTSSGTFAGNSTLAAEVINHAFEKKWPVTIRFGSTPEDIVSVTRG